MIVYFDCQEKQIYFYKHILLKFKSKLELFLIQKSKNVNAQCVGYSYFPYQFKIVCKLYLFHFRSQLNKTVAV